MLNALRLSQMKFSPLTGIFSFHPVTKTMNELACIRETIERITALEVYDYFEHDRISQGDLIS